MKRIFIEARLKLGYLYRGFKTRKSLHLMDTVWYNGKIYFINNMVSSCGQCGTRLVDLVENVPNFGTRVHVKVSEAKLKKVRGFENWKRGLLANYRFQMAYWHVSNLAETMTGGEHDVQTSL